MLVRMPIKVVLLLCARARARAQVRLLLLLLILACSGWCAAEVAEVSRQANNKIMHTEIINWRCAKWSINPSMGGAQCDEPIRAENPCINYLFRILLITTMHTFSAQFEKNHSIGG